MRWADFLTYLRRDVGEPESFNIVGGGLKGMDIDLALTNGTIVRVYFNYYAHTDEGRRIMEGWYMTEPFQSHVSAQDTSTWSPIADIEKLKGLRTT